MDIHKLRLAKWNLFFGLDLLILLTNLLLTFSECALLLLGNDFSRKYSQNMKDLPQSSNLNKLFVVRISYTVITFVPNLFVNGSLTTHRY